MLRLTGFTFATFIALCSESPSPTHDVAPATRDSRPATVDVRELIAAAHGAPPVVCALAAQAVDGWGSWNDAPVTPLPRPGRRESRHERLATDDVQFLLSNLGAGDACVSELAVRLLASDESEAVTDGLVRNLAA